MNFKEALHFRHACKVFDKDKKIDKKTLDEIIEAGRLAPSSVGMQPWKLLLIRNEALRQRLREVCWNQSQITDCSELIVILARTTSLLPTSDYIKRVIDLRDDKTAEQREQYRVIYENFVNNNIGTSKKELFAWSKAQCFLNASNIMMQAAIEGIDSCPIEGFDIAKANKVLELDNSEYEIAIMVCLGYRKNPQTGKYRLPTDEILTVIE